MARATISETTSAISAAPLDLLESAHHRAGARRAELDGELADPVLAQADRHDPPVRGRQLGETPGLTDDAASVVPYQHGRIAAHRALEGGIEIGIRPGAALVGGSGSRRDRLRQAGLLLYRDPVDVSADGLRADDHVHGDRRERDGHEHQREPAPELADTEDLAVTPGGGVQPSPPARTWQTHVPISRP
jgi:hypothetical protein